MDISNTNIYICSTKLALKMTLTKRNDENIEKLVFKDYFNSLPTDDDRNAIRDQMFPKYMGYTTFYTKIRNNSFTELEFEKLESLTSQTFER